jgi:2-polyprenyl-6-hydroxyphenyl methylase/3-demethylubiquinone-9 3-methyltransferase
LKSSSRTIDPDEISRFSREAPQWWNETGPFAPLHRMNPARVNYIKSIICRHSGRDVKDMHALDGLKILDAGCGGGLICEPLARLGGNVTGIDGDAVAIDVARDHSARAGLEISYINTTTDNLLETARDGFDVVLALEIVEHVADVDGFVDDCVNLCRPGGLVIFSTLNRTLKSMALGKIAAEYILRWVPAGTHDWRKFVKPSRLASALRAAGAHPDEIKGLVFNPLRGEFSISSHDLDVNYFIVSTRGQP